MRFILIFIGLITFVSVSQARVLPGWFDLDGLPVHTADEVYVQVDTSVIKVPQGYKYTYALTSLPSSLQNIVQFEVAVPDPYSVIAGSEASPWLRFQGSYPNKPGSLAAADPTFIYPKSSLTISWVNFFASFSPSTVLSGFTFISPYPPQITEAHIRGDTEEPVFQDEEQELPEFYDQSIYGPGKVIPVVGPVKPATPNVTDNYSVIGCAGGICDVQLDITGPQDPTGTAYSYLWTGVFGTATGAKPIVQLAAGAYTVSVAVSDPYATLVTATMPITVIDPNPPVVTPPVGGGNTGGGTNLGGAGNGGNNQGGGAGQGTGSNAGNGNTGGNNQGVNGNVGTGSNDMDHDGITDDQDDDRDGDGKPNNEDADPDHPD